MVGDVKVGDGTAKARRIRRSYIEKEKRQYAGKDADMHVAEDGNEDEDAKNKNEETTASEVTDGDDVHDSSECEDYARPSDSSNTTPP